ncbi:MULTISPECIES: creatininase family protein [Haloferacaceae]|uniref:Creatininase family protein n=1 Tax=Halorubrum glutamatedens TaxID=2707018 RepID=A0ABD5QW95_9EURY|nr:creatininase family protein [Halobellus captivus]
MSQEKRRQRRNQYLLERLSWPDIQRRIENGSRTVILPIGAVEQHGPHLPLGTDSFIGESLGCRLAAELGDALVAPVIRVGVSEEHTSFSGTISVGIDALFETIRGHVRSVATHGVETVVLLPTHGGNIPPVRTIAPELADELPETTVVPIADLDRYTKAMNRALSEVGIEIDEPVIHAGATETAAMLAIEPDLVSMEDADPGHEGDVSYARILNHGFEAVTESGVLGDPTVATTEAGEHLLSVLTEEFSDWIHSERTAANP